MVNVCQKISFGNRYCSLFTVEHTRNCCQWNAQWKTTKKENREAKQKSTKEERGKRNDTADTRIQWQ